jgi:alkaline phosphatase D
VPLAQPTGSPAARDGWADVDTPSGFERELTGILAELRDAGTRGLVFLTTDVHFAAIHRLTPFEDTPEFRIHQVISGPLNAGLFPNPTLDDTLHPETLFFHGPASAASVTSWDEARRWFNFGLIEVEPQGNLAIRIVDANGRQVGDALLPKP